MSRKRFNNMKVARISALCLARDSRHSFASIANDLGFTEITIAALIGHAKGSVTSNYVHTLDSTLIMAADTVSGYVKALLEGVEFRRNTYTLDRQTRRTAINDMLIEARPGTQKDAFDHASSVL